nr:invasion associated locus B family protein [Bradyrhizobium sacchari]
MTQFLEAHSATGSPPQQQAPGRGDQEGEPALKPPRVSLPQNIHYSNWQKLCFKSSDGTTVCRTTSSGTDDLGQVIVRADLIERADGRARLQLFVPQGANLQQGVKVRIDQGRSTQIPFNWCLANICIAAAGVDPALVAELKNGHELKLEVANFISSSASTTLPLNRFAAARKGAPAQTYDFGLDED